MGFFRKYKTIEELLPGFILEKEMHTGLKASQSYHTHIMVFVDWLKENDCDNIPMVKITPEQMESFFIELAVNKKLDKPTCERYFIHLRLLFIYALKRKEIKSLPFDLVTFPKKKEDKSAEVIRSEHLKPLLLEIKRIDPQLFLACMIEYYCFIRPGKELRFLKIGHIDLANGTITILQENAKNHLRQSITIPNQLIEIFIEYGIDTADKNLYIFGVKGDFGNKPISVNMLRWRFNKVRDRLGLPKGYKFYSFKHTGATNLHLSGISMRELMDQLRHSKLEATQHYIKTKMAVVNPKIRDHFPNPLI